jgi:hypothetical protein
MVRYRTQYRKMGKSEHCHEMPVSGLLKYHVTN